jgi:hypothetical protein
LTQFPDDIADEGKGNLMASLGLMMQAIIPREIIGNGFQAASFGIENSFQDIVHAPAVTSSGSQLSFFTSKNV